MRIFQRYIAVLLLCSVHTSYLGAQKLYLEGIITDNENQTRHGLIDYRDWNYNPEIIRFIPGANDTPLTFSPSTIKFFSVNNENYISAVVTVERTPAGMDELLIDGRRKLAEDNVFLKVLLEGETDLYYLNERQSGRHFYIRKNDGSDIIELAQYNAVADIEGRKKLVTRDEYKDQLKNLMGDCPMLVPLVHLADYTAEDLTELVREYNKCMGQEPDYIAELPSVEYQLRISAGISAFKLDFFGSGSRDLAAAGFPVTYKPAAAVGLDIIFPVARKAFSVYNELGFQQWEVHDDVLWYENENEYDEIEISLGGHNIRLLSVFMYTYPARKIKPYVYAGLVNVFNTITRNNKITVAHFYTTETESTGVALPDYRRYTQSLAAGLGLKYKNAGIDLRYERGNDITRSMNLNSCTNIVFVNLHYSF
jgi:hypothetical protein